MSFNRESSVTAAMTPRRSSRARTTQPPPSIPHLSSSSSSSNPHGRGERSTRSNHKVPSPRRSSTQRSLSSDDPDSGSKPEFPQTRQRQRARDDEDHDNKPNSAQQENNYDDGEEEEITRCLCNQQEYPGLPPSRREALDGGGGGGGGDAGSGSGVNHEGASNLPADSSDMPPDEIGSMFIQCDTCKVWQHGGCVGIMDEAMSPDEYFCEECRKDLHTVKSEPNGQYSSQYLPVAPAPSPPPSSRGSSKDSRTSKSARSRQNDTPAAKRRSTNNSREAAYDEEEQLRRAIEESKGESRTSPEEVTTRRGKRSRSDSEANKQAAKRQRTGSVSPASASKRSHSLSQPASEDEAKTKAATNGVRKQRAQARNQREKETKDTEEVEQEPAASASNGRKGRSEQRRGESEFDHGAESPSKTVVNGPEPEAEPSHPSPGPPVPAQAQEPAPARPSTRKSGRPPMRRGARGRNQYTRDRDFNMNGTDLTNSPRRGYSHDVGVDSPRPNGTHTNGGESGKPSRPRYMNPQRTTMNEMKRRVAAILEFISRMQVEMAAAGENSSTPTSNGDRPNGTISKDVARHLENAMQSMAGENEGSGQAKDSAADPTPKEKDFKDLSSIEMMDVLTRHLLKWQQEYGKFGER